MVVLVLYNAADGEGASGAITAISVAAAIACPSRGMFRA